MGGPLFGEKIPLGEELLLTEVKFFAYEEKKKETPPKKRFLVFGGRGFSKMEALNRYIEWINDNFNGSINHLDYYQSYGVQIEHRLVEKLYGGITYNQYEANTGGPLVFMGTTHHFEIDLGVRGGEVYLKKIWPRVLKPVDLETLLGIGYYASEYKEKEDGYEVSGQDKKLSLRAGVGLTWRVTQFLYLFMETDYRWLKFNEYRDGDEIINFLSPGNPQVEVDFSGLTLSAGLIYPF